MDPIDTLSQEHRVIERVLDALEAWALRAARRTESNDKAELSRFVAFLRGFADACHHGKEEHILFATMTEHGFSRNEGPLSVMLHEHEQGRALIATLDTLARRDQPWSANDRETLVRTAHTYAGLLRRHIVKEDRILYPQAKAALPDVAWNTIAHRFERFEEEETGSGEHERLHRLAESLIVAHARKDVYPETEHAHFHRH